MNPLPGSSAPKPSAPAVHSPEPTRGRAGIKLLAVFAALVAVCGASAVLFASRSSDGAPMASAPLPPAAHVAAGGPAGSGVYVGPARPAAAKQFGVWRGVPVTFAADNLGWTSWKDIARPDWFLRRWHRGGLSLVLGVPMLPNNPSTTIAAGAKGRYDKHFRTLARDLVRHGEARASLRLGWEMTGDWYRWSAQPHPAAWIAYYRQIVTTMRHVPGAHFSFDWNPNMGDSGMAAAAAYPGDAYVDEIGMDVYDWKWNDPTATPAQRWSWMQQQPSGLDWLSSFAAAHDKPIALPEWGLATPAQNAHGGGGDDPYFVRHLLTWAHARHAAYEVYFDYGKSVLRHFPHSARVYRRIERSAA